MLERSCLRGYEPQGRTHQIVVGALFATTGGG